MSMTAFVLLKISTNSSLPPDGPRNLSSLITIGVATAPVPASATMTGAPALGDTFNAAFFTPPAIGANDTTTVVDVPGLSAVAPGAPAEKRAASAPLSVNGVVTTIGVALTLVSVAVCVAVVDAGTMPKVTVAGDAVSTIGAGTTLTVNDVLPLHPLATVACTLKRNVPVATGVPANTPPALSVSPPGRVPLATENV